MASLNVTRRVLRSSGAAQESHVGVLAALPPPKAPFSPAAVPSAAVAPAPSSSGHQPARSASSPAGMANIEAASSAWLIARPWSRTSAICPLKLSLLLQFRRQPMVTNRGVTSEIAPGVPPLPVRPPVSSTPLTNTCR